MSRGNYNTKQRSLIKTYLKENAGKHITIKDVQKHLDETDNHVGLTTIYRHMDELVRQGYVNKYVVDSNTSACFEYSLHKKNCQEHFHLKCEVCHELIHLDCKALSSIEKHLFEHHNFNLNLHKTVFYGVCKNCTNKTNEKNINS